MQVEHEADQRPLQPRPGAHVHRKPRPAQLGRAFQVEDPQRFAQLPVRLGLKVERTLLAPGLHRDVVGFGGADGHFIAGQVGNARQRKPHLLVESGRGLVQFVELVFQRAGLVHHRGRVLPGLLQRAHLLAQLVAPRLQRLGLGDGLAPPLIERAKIAQQRSRVGAARAQFFFHSSRLPRTNPRSSMALPVYRTMSQLPATALIIADRTNPAAVELRGSRRLMLFSHRRQSTSGINDVS